MRGIFVRRAVPGDEEGISAVCIKGQYFTYETLYTKEYIESIISRYYGVDRIRDEILHVSHEWNGYVVAEDHGIIVGAIGGGMIDEGVAEIYVLYLDPKRRGEGIGTKLLEYYTDLQKRQYGAVEQWVSVAKGNEYGIPFYEARGFLFNSEQIAYGSKPEDEDISLRYSRSL